MSIQPDKRIPAIIAALKRNNMSYRSLAKLMGRDHTVITNWLNGKNAPHDRRVFDDILATVENYSKSTEGAANNVDVRRVGIRQVAVYLNLLGGEGSPDAGDTKMINLMDWGTARERYGCKVLGLEMVPMLEPNNVAIIEKDRDWSPRDVVHAIVRGKHYLRMVRRRGTSLSLEALDGDYPSIECSESDIQGVVVTRQYDTPDGRHVTEDWPNGMHIRPSL
jgi:SOS-response transcriptional repressor LexA